jgi:hypothetical protein
MHKNDTKKVAPAQPVQSLAEQQEAGFQEEVSRLREKQELGSIENSYDGAATKTQSFGEVSYGSKGYSDEISQDEIDSVVDPTESDE